MKSCIKSAMPQELDERPNSVVQHVKYSQSSRRTGIPSTSKQSCDWPQTNDGNSTKADTVYLETIFRGLSLVRGRDDSLCNWSNRLDGSIHMCLSMR